MIYSLYLLNLFRVLMFCIFAAYCTLSGLVVKYVYECVSLYGVGNPAYWFGIVIACLVVLGCLFSAYSQLLMYEKETLYNSVVGFAILFSLFAASPAFEYLVSVRHRELLKNPSIANETFHGYLTTDLIDRLTVERTQVDAKCCGHDNKRVWATMGYDPAFPATKTFVDEKKRLYPAHCCERSVISCSGNSVFEKGCKVLPEFTRKDLEAKIKYRFNYPSTIFLAWIGICFLHMITAYFYHDLLTGLFFNTISGY